MFQGFYNLTSEMLTQTRNMNVISNNMANVSTPGYKSETFIASAFREEMMARYRGVNDVTPGGIGTIQLVRCAAGTKTDYTPSMFRESTSVLDFALTDKGFFCVQTYDGDTVYTRHGSFTLDDEGYITLPGVGRVLGTNGPIKLPTDNITADSFGNIVSAEDPDEIYGTLSIVDFEDYDEQLLKADNNTFIALDDAAGTAVQNPALRWQATEMSNVDLATEMTRMMSGQRALDSAAQVLRLYNGLIEKTVNQMGPAAQ